MSLVGRARGGGCSWRKGVQVLLWPSKHRFLDGNLAPGLLGVAHVSQDISYRLFCKLYNTPRERRAVATRLAELLVKDGSNPDSVWTIDGLLPCDDAARWPVLDDGLRLASPLTAVEQDVSALADDKVSGVCPREILVQLERRLAFFGVTDEVKYSRFGVPRYLRTSSNDVRMHGLYRCASRCTGWMRHRVTLLSSSICSMSSF
eukprot:2338855-Prymnesium_polylepis.1